MSRPARLYPKKQSKPLKSDLMILITGLGLTLFFIVLFIAMLKGFKGVESGLVFNGSWI